MFSHAYFCSIFLAMADSGYMSQAPSAVKIMSVPDTIQLSSDPQKTTSSKPVQQRDYRPMKVLKLYIDF